jgi:hypothetical protein
MHVLNKLCQGSYKALKHYGACQPGEIAVGYGGQAQGRDPLFAGYLVRQKRQREESEIAEEEEGDLAENFILSSDHSYAARPKKTKTVKYKFLYALSVSGERKKIFNSIQRAVAVLGNSKKLFFGHLDVMFKALRPELAELCYVDTDSCIWSLSRERVEDCLKKGAKKFWQDSSVFADESGPQSCHGKLKHEGSFDGGQFKAVKIYRLYSAKTGQEGEEEEEDWEELSSGNPYDAFKRRWKVTYTRCKGVDRRTANVLADESFDPASTSKTTVHRTCLRPTRTGEMLMKVENRSLAVPFNFKRRVCPSGLHTFCLQ